MAWAFSTIIRSMCRDSITRTIPEQESPREPSQDAYHFHGQDKTIAWTRCMGLSLIRVGPTPGCILETVLASITL